MKKLSVALAVRNEEDNIGRCLESVKDIADEIIVIDEFSKDNTISIAKKYGAQVYEEPHHDIFHITKQKALDKASGEWILQLDADEIVTEGLAKEIREVIEMNNEDILKRRPKDKYKWKLFQRHQHLIEKRDGRVGVSGGEVVALFLPRKNMFLGKPLIHAGVYPDPAIRLIRNGKARFPAKSVHEIMTIDGKVAWLFNDLEHHDSPTLKRYLMRMNRYTDLHAQELADKKTPKNFWQFANYTVLKPKLTFLSLFIRHKGFQDGIRGFLWSVFSSLHFPLAYFKYLTGGYR